MPVMTGMECARKIRELQRVGKISFETKLLLVTGDTLNEVSQQNRHFKEDVPALFDAVLYKPLEKRELYDLLDKYNLWSDNKYSGHKVNVL